VSVPAALLGALMPRIALRERIARRRHGVLRRLPHDLDLITLSIEAGLNLGAAIGQAAQYGPPGPLRDEWQRVLRDVHAGQARHEALRAMAARMALPGVSNLVAALITAERQGASLAPILRAQAEQRRTERFLRAERMAMEAPVKMLLPLVLCIFPGTFAILLFPIVYQLLQEGVL
jgi:tight adherence protein C